MCQYNAYQEPTRSPEVCTPIDSITPSPAADQESHGDRAETSRQHRDADPFRVAEAQQGARGESSLQQVHLEAWDKSFWRHGAKRHQHPIH